jgi:hypothetical protein
MQVLGAAARQRFEDESVALLRAEFPSTTAAHSDQVLRQFVSLGIERARAYQVVAVTDVERWLRLMVRLGPKFDEDPQHLGVRDILVKREMDAKLRMDEIDVLTVGLGAPRS